MVAWLIEKCRLVTGGTIAVSLISALVFFQFSDISFDLPISVMFYWLSTILIYLFCFSWPFLGAATIEMNNRLVGGGWSKAESLAKFLLWFALVGGIIAILGILVGDLNSALGVSGSCGLLAGSCDYLSRQRSKDEQTAVN